MERYQASGNGQVPIVAAAAWRLMQQVTSGASHGP
jgi:hypothetical protein